ncbi:Asp/Glu/Hydantoin racemase [compost metagenome]
MRERVSDTVRARKRDGADAVFIACTALRVAGLIGPLEREIGLPIVASNHALAWHALDLAGRKHRDGEGRLFQI